eukprot:30995-Pelagococcus_subviridis.AAC.6
MTTRTSERRRENHQRVPGDGGRSTAAPTRENERRRARRAKFHVERRDLTNEERDLTNERERVERTHTRARRRCNEANSQIESIFLRPLADELLLHALVVLYVHLQDRPGLQPADVVVVGDEDVRLLEHLHDVHGLALELVRDLFSELQVALPPERNLAVMPLARDANLQEHGRVFDGDHLVVARLPPPRVVYHLRGVVRGHDPGFLELREESHLQRFRPQLRGLRRAPRHLQVHREQETKLQVVVHLDLRLVPLPLRGVLLDPRHLLVRVQRVRVAVLGRHRFPGQVRVERVQVDRFVDLHPERDHAARLVERLRHRPKNRPPDEEPRHHGDQKPQHRLVHERFDDELARPRRVHDGPLPGDAVQDGKREEPRE